MNELMAKIRALLPDNYAAVIATCGGAASRTGGHSVADEYMSEVYGRLANAVDEIIKGIADAMRAQEGDGRADRFLAEVEQFRRSAPGVIVIDVRSQIIPEGDEDARRNSL
jgi:hypothetical protein